ncbi:MAG: hypothetical protein AB7K52_11535 [Phycisphaerales bacterium]
MMKQSSAAAAAAIVLGAFIGLGSAGCSGPPQTSRLRGSDLELATTEVTQQLAESPFLSGRSASSPVAILQPRPMENLSDNRLSVGDQWSAMSLILMNPNVFQMLRDKNVQLLVPRESRRDATLAGLSSTAPAGDAPTHIFQPVLRTITRGGGGESKDAARRDVYLMEYTIAELPSRRVVWSGQTTFSRVAHGSLID